MGQQTAQAKEVYWRNDFMQKNFAYMQIYIYLHAHIYIFNLHFYIYIFNLHKFAYVGNRKQ